MKDMRLIKTENFQAIGLIYQYWIVFITPGTKGTRMCRTLCVRTRGLKCATVKGEVNEQK